MSHTPDDQFLDDRIEKLIDAAKDLEKAMWERIENPSEWRDPHITELGLHIEDLTALRFKFSKLKARVR